MEGNNKKVSLLKSQGEFNPLSGAKQKTPLDLDTLMGYSSLLAPHYLDKADGFFAKTNKALIMHFMLEDHRKVVAYPKDSMFILDGNALFHTMTNLEPTFRGITLSLQDLMLNKHDFVFSTDSYHPRSIKIQERLRQGCGEQFLRDGSAARNTEDFKEYLTNDENKRQLYKLILDVWASSSAAAQLQKCNSILVVDGKAHKLETRDGQVRPSLLVMLMVKDSHYW